MEPIAHFLTGACIGRAGFNRKTAYATVTAVLAAEAADLDVLWGIAGPVEELKHHRGITHTLIGAPVVAGVVVAAVWGFHRWRQARRQRRLSASSPTDVLLQKVKAPSVHWGWLYVTALAAALSHLVLDWTNNYGLRPFYPFNPRWYAANLAFIAEPVLWALLGVALFMPWVLGLADREIGARRKPFRGRGWAIFALAGTVALWGWRWIEQTEARTLLENLPVTSEPVTRMALEPYPVNPYRWHAIVETRDSYQTAEIDTWNPDSPAAIQSDPLEDVIYKPADTPAVEAAKRTFLGRVYLDWGSWAVVRDVGPVPIPGPVPGLDPPRLPPSQHWTTVEFTDLRFDYPFLGTRGTGGRAPLSGWVYIVDGRDAAGESMDGREQTPP